jgi:hypothetical protein
MLSMFSIRCSSRRGLSAEYFSGRRFGRNEPAARRIDDQIDFDFKTDSPVGKISEARKFSIRWKGSVVARATGECEFVCPGQNV